MDLMGETAASRDRLQTARDIVARCPPELALEAAVTGSVALGLADDGSDIELNLWVVALPDEMQRDGWLAALGASDAKVQQQPWGDGSMAVTFRLRGVTIEVGWQTIEALEMALRSVMDEYRTSRLTLAYAVS